MKKIVALGITSLAVVSAVGVATVSASALNGNGNQTGSNDGTHTGMQLRDGSGAGGGNGNGYQSSLEFRAKVVGMTPEQLRTALQTKTMSQIAAEKGMTQSEFQTKMDEAVKARWESRGLGAAEIATRLAEREKRQAANEADGHVFGSGAGNHQGYGRTQQ